MKKTLVIGSTVADVIVRVNHLPRTGEDLDIDEQTLSLGGCAYNVTTRFLSSTRPPCSFLRSGPAFMEILSITALRRLKSKPLPRG